MTSTSAASPARIAPPSPLLMLAEGRAFLELGAFYALRGLLGHLPKGDGHPVIVMPGFMAGDVSTQPMRRLLTSLGYEAHGWSLGRNVRIDSEREAAMNDLVARVADKAGRKVSLIGWSLGGVFVREIAKAQPDNVRQVISLGSPISNDRGATNARKLFEMLNGAEPEPVKQGRFRDLETAPPVPTTCVFTRTDSVVAWRGSVQKGGEQVENIEVHASHIGLGVNPAVMLILADRLAQAEGQWKPFERTGLRSLMYGGHATH